VHRKLPQISRCLRHRASHLKEGSASETTARVALMQDLNGLIDPASQWTLTEATVINDNGWIAGYGIRV